MITIRVFSLCCALALILVSCSPSGTGDITSRKLIADKCSACHTTRRIFKTHRSSRQWDDIVNRMIRHGAELSPDEAGNIKNYLADQYGQR